MRATDIKIRVRTSERLTSVAARATEHSRSKIYLLLSDVRTVLFKKEMTDNSIDKSPLVENSQRLPNKIRADLVI